MKQKTHWLDSIVDRDNSENGSEAEYSSVEIIQFEEQREKRLK